MTIANDNVVAFKTHTDTNGVDEHINRTIDEAIERAVAHYRAGEPGRGEYVLRRLGLRLTRLEQVRQ